MKRFNGAWPALVTPFTADDQINVSVLRDLTDYLIDKGVAGLYLCGSTGQGIHTSVEERKLVTETVVDQANGRIDIITHVGSQVMDDAVDLAAHAQSTGVEGVSSIIPAGYNTIDTICDYYSTVARAAPNIAFLPYLFTSAIDSVALINALRDIPNLAGTKYTGPNMYEFRHVVEAREGDWSVFSGMDEQCVFAAMFGSCGNIGSTLNVMPGIYSKIHKAYAADDLIQARDLQLRANRITRVLINHDFMGALKAAISLLGFDCGQPRLPALPFSEKKQAALKADLEAVDFFEIAAIS